MNRAAITLRFAVYAWILGSAAMTRAAASEETLITPKNKVQEGAWSVITNDLKARLIVTPTAEGAFSVYLELQNLQTTGFPKGIWFRNPESTKAQLTEGDGTVLPRGHFITGYSYMDHPFWISLPSNSTLRFLIGGASFVKRRSDGGSELLFLTEDWDLGNSKELYLGVTLQSLKPPDGGAPRVNINPWDGEITIPKIKIPYPFE